MECISKYKVSIVIPVYNREHSIKKAIKSVLEQDYYNIEVIIVDDCSTDHTEEVIKSLDDTRIKFIKHTVNKGANAARNTGILASSGEFIAFQDSDDEWLPKKLSKQMKVFQDTDDTKLGVVYTAFWKIEDNNSTYIPSKNILKTSGYIHDVLLSTNFISTQTLLIKKACLLDVGMFDENLPRLQDWELLLRLSKYCNFYLVDEALVNVYHTDNSISTNQKALLDTLVLILDKHYDDFAKNSKTLAAYYCYMSQQLYLLGETGEMYKYCLKALKRNTLKVKFWFILASFVFGKTFYKKVKDTFIYVSSKIGQKRKI